MDQIKLVIHKNMNSFNHFRLNFLSIQFKKIKLPTIKSPFTISKYMNKFHHSTLYMSEQNHVQVMFHYI